ncbi:MAG: flagellar biosynthesis protein FlhF [Thermoguttaceae bacterium]|nr:flagellar biosynthesis protein FlhF [Thermoguttaceae bacterium]MDW8077699.1 flagellar biosynthesis protein FlhF [Thermoguttaceae bacterium]
MEIRTYRAATMQEAMEIIRRELGPDAAILHAREVRRSRLFGLLPGTREIEVTASCGVRVPYKLAPEPVYQPPRTVSAAPSAVKAPEARTEAVAAPNSDPFGPRWSREIAGKIIDLHGMVRELCQRSRGGQAGELPESLFRMFTDLIEADVPEELAREYVERVRQSTSGPDLLDPKLLRAHLCRLVEEGLSTTGPIAVEPGRRRLVALVGPTGVGKTTTIAKLAAHYRLRERRNVGLITVDTYRIAAVEQLRTYAEIIDLPMHVVATPREMRETVRRLEHLDLILMDTAGRSPRDEIKLQELKAFLTEARADEVHLVLSAVAAPKTLQLTAEQFANVGTTALILTKLDEANTLGHLLPLLRTCRLPLSYLTTGQNVPEDIEVAEISRLARLLLGWESVKRH